MSEAVTTNEDGALVIDMAKADALWRSLDPLKQAELTNIMFEPVLKKAKEQAKHIEELEAKLAKVAGSLEDMCAEFRGYDLPYGSKAYTKATATLAELKGQKDGW